MRSPRISAVVATHNGSAHLPHALPALFPDAQDLDAGAYEVLVIDNASTDGSGDLARTLARGVPNLRVVEEPAPGLSRARNRGIHEAAAPTIAFIDDDAAASPGWLASYVRLFAEERNAWSAGGPIAVRWMSARPRWWTGGLDEIFNRWDRGPKRHALRYPKVPIGTNMAFRRSAFDTAGLFDEGLGRTGGSLNAGEEAEIALRIRAAGGRSYYEPGALVHHFGYADRLSPAFARRRAAAHARARCRVDLRHFGVRRVPHQLARVTLGALRVALHHRLGVEEQLPFIYFRAYFSELHHQLSRRG